MVATTWVVPAAVFFTSIIGWQYFVGYRSVPDDKCFVQYMENSVFNCLLQIGYFWATMAVMCALYAGIYRVALRLHHKSRDRRRRGLQHQQLLSSHQGSKDLLHTLPMLKTASTMDRYGTTSSDGDAGSQLNR
jgi:muscarinic acetylcholine receptor M3